MLRIKFICLLCLSIMSAMPGISNTFVVDGIEYGASGSTKECDIRKIENYNGPVIFHKNVRFNNVQYKVVDFDNWSFVGCDKITLVDFSEITDILSKKSESYRDLLRFEGCSKLKRVIGLPNNIEKLSWNAFYNCHELSTADMDEWLPESIKTIDNYVFGLDSQQNPTDMNVPTNWEYISDKAFTGREFNTVNILHNESSLRIPTGFPKARIINIERNVGGTGIVSDITQEIYNITSPTDFGYSNSKELRVIKASHWKTQNINVNSYLSPISLEKLELRGSEVERLTIENVKTLKSVILPSVCRYLSLNNTGLYKTYVDFARSECRGLLQLRVLGWPESVFSLQGMTFDGVSDNEPRFVGIYSSDKIKTLYFTRGFDGYIDYDQLDNLKEVHIGSKVSGISGMNPNGCKHEVVFLGSLEQWCSSIKVSSYSDWNSSIATGTRALLTNVTKLWYGHGSEKVTYLSGELSTENISKISPMIFSGYEPLTSVNITANTEVGFGAFYKCAGLKKIRVNCSTVSASLFQYDNAVEKVTIGSNVKEIEPLAFGNWSAKTDHSLYYEGTPSQLVKIKLLKVRTYDNYVFRANLPIVNKDLYIDGKLVKGLVFDEYVDSVPSGHFSNFTVLTSVTFVNGYPGIFGSACFYNCYNLAQIGLLMDATAIKPKGTSKKIKVESSAFENDVALYSIGFLDQIGEVQYNSFSNTKWMNEQPDGPLYIGSSLLTYIGSAPENTTIEIKDGTTIICEDALRNQSGIKSISFPKTLREIQPMALHNIGLTGTLTLPPSIVIIDNNPISSDGLTKLVIEDGETPLSSTTDLGCQNLTEVYLGREYFSEQNSANMFINPLTVTTLAFGPMVRNIPGYIFSDTMSELSMLKCYNPVPPSLGTVEDWDSYETKTALDMIDKQKCTLEVPSGAVQAYRNAEGWKDFYNIREIASIDEVLTDGKNTSTIGFYNTMGVFSKTPFKGLNIEVKSDGTRRKLIVE